MVIANIQRVIISPKAIIINIIIMILIIIIIIMIVIIIIIIIIIIIKIIIIIIIFFYLMRVTQSNGKDLPWGPLAWLQVARGPQAYKVVEYMYIAFRYRDLKEGKDGAHLIASFKIFQSHLLPSYTGIKGFRAFYQRLDLRMWCWGYFRPIHKNANISKNYCNPVMLVFIG